MPQQKIILDCDNTMGLPLKEVDDGLTLLYLLGRSELDILGITTTFGNGAIEEVYPQTQRLAQSLGLRLPVWRGEGARHQDPNTPAARFLVDAVQQYPGEITLLATGPLGNLAAAAKLDPDFFAHVREVVTMGGYIQPMKLGYRNLAELNFSCNPEAACTVLHAPPPITVMSGQACLDAPFTLRQINRIDYWPGRFKWLLRHWLVSFGLFCGVAEFYLWDLLPAVYLTEPDLFSNAPFSLTSDIQELETGHLEAGAGQEATIINLPDGIQNRDRFYDILDTAWREAARKYPIEDILREQRIPDD
jgi:inosine-uridine nucleoside N-ribohydrolase